MIKIISIIFKSSFIADSLTHSALDQIHPAVLSGLGRECARWFALCLGKLMFDAFHSESQKSQQMMEYFTFFDFNR